jgi:hypothetical protein
MEKMNLGELLHYAQRHGIFTKLSKDYPECHFSYHTYCVVIDKFSMQTNSHDTGYSTSVYIVGGEEPYNILNGTYWKRPGYDFNKFYRENGAWDNAFNAAIEKLRDAVNESINNASFKLAALKKGVEVVKQEKKQKIETMFL